MEPKKRQSPVGAGLHQDSAAKCRTNSTPPADYDLSTSAQRLRLLAALRKGPLSTIQARRELAVLHPAARVMELRVMGFNILTHWREESDSLGVEHRVANYVLMHEAGGAA